MRERSGTPSLHEVGSEDSRAGNPPRGLPSGLCVADLGPKKEPAQWSAFSFFLFFFKPSLDFRISHHCLYAMMFLCTFTQTSWMDDAFSTSLGSLMLEDKDTIYFKFRFGLDLPCLVCPSESYSS